MASRSQSKWDVVVIVGDIITVSTSGKATYMLIDGEEVWLPNSQFKQPSIQNEYKPKRWTVFIPRWLAEERDLAYMEEEEWEDMKEE